MKGCTILVFPEGGANRPVASSEALSGQVIPFVPFRVQRDFPDLWRDYLHAHFACIADVALAFGVTERAARRWWNGAGPRGAFVAMALRLHPQTAPAYLLHDDAWRAAA
ncbi:hypothetical protein [uncultured Sulfitobacter sp.]|uniref:hypothetical protein n=1 Tax=uncultured Sulfitobacter sp. TaxID=191468 RepID=UPI002631FB09|nr:hypothetical protein [uncultured Sulfitobacter sp.]